MIAATTAFLDSAAMRAVYCTQGTGSSPDYKVRSGMNDIVAS